MNNAGNDLSHPIGDSLAIDVDVHTSYNHPDIQNEIFKRIDKEFHPSDNKLFGAYVQDGWSRTMGGRFPMDQVKVTEPTGITGPLMDEFGVDHAIVNNFVPIDLIPETRRVVEEVRAMNDVLVEKFLDESDRLSGLLTLTTRKPDWSAEEIDRMADEDGIVGVFLSSGGAEKPLGHPRHDVIYQAAEDNDLPIVIHGSTGAIATFDAPVLNRGLEKFIEIRTLGHSWCQMLTLTSLLFEEVPEKFPGLNFVILEAGIGWVPYMMGRMNREHSQRKANVPLLKKSPEAYIRDSFYFGSQPLGEFDDPKHMQQIVEILGAESIMLATDHPHFDFDNPDALDKFLRNLSSEERDLVLHQNAVDVFNLEL